MAIDYSGLLTGISQDPKAQAAEMLAQSAIAQNPNLYAGTQYAMGQAPRREAAMRQAVGGLLGRDLRSSSEKARQDLQEMSTAPGFNPNDPTQQKKLLELARVVNPAEAVKVASQIEQQNNLRTSLIKIAKSQGNTEIEDFLNAGGNPTKAAEVLFRKKEVIEPKSYTVTSSDEVEYLDAWNSLTDDQKVMTGVAEPTKLLGLGGGMLGISEDPVKLRQLFARAEQIMSMKPPLGGRPVALQQAMGEMGGTGVPLPPSVPPETMAVTKQAPTGDPFRDTANLFID